MTGKQLPDILRQLPATGRTVDTAEFFLSNGAVRVLDIGCGKGRQSIYFARHGLQPTGIDSEPSAVALAQRWAIDEGLNATFVEASSTELPFEAGSFDAVAAGSALDGLSEAESQLALVEIRRVLRPGGSLFIAFTAAALTGRGSDADTAWRPHPEADIRALLAGFIIVDLQTHETGDRWVFAQLEK